MAMRTAGGILVSASVIIVLAIVGGRAIWFHEPQPAARVASQGHKQQLQSLAWDQFELFITGGEKADGTYDQDWGPWETWITRNDLLPQRKTSALVVAPSEKETGFKQLLWTGLNAATVEKDEPARKRSPQKCDPAVPAPCSTVLYNAVVQKHIDANHLLDPDAVGAMPKGEQGGIREFPDGSIIVKTAWLVVRPWKGHAGLGFINFSDPDHPGVNIVYVTLNGDGLCKQAVPIPRGLPQSGAAVTSISIQCFFAVQITNKAEAQAVAKGVGSVAVNDWVALVGMNVVRKWQGHWTWSTIWWTPEPADDPEYNAKPQPLQDARWAYYRANAIDSIFDQMDHSKRLICYNPYLEKEVNNQQDSNCLICHRLAEYRTPSDAFTLGSPGKNEPVVPRPDYYATSVRTDFIWTISDILETAHAQRAH